MPKLQRHVRRALNQFMAKRQAPRPEQRETSARAFVALLDEVGEAWQALGGTYAKNGSRPDELQGGRFYARTALGRGDRVGVYLEFNYEGELVVRLVDAQNQYGKAPDDGPPLFWDRISAAWEPLSDDDEVTAVDALAFWVMALFELHDATALS